MFLVGTGSFTQTVRGLPLGSPDGAGLEIFSLDLKSKSFNHEGRTAAGTNPSYVAWHPALPILFATNEAGAKSSDVVAASVDSAAGKFVELKRQESLGHNPSALAVDPSGRWLALSYFMSSGAGGVGLFPIDAPEGAVGAARAYNDWGAGEKVPPPFPEEFLQQLCADGFGVPEGSESTGPPTLSMVHDVEFHPTNNYLVAVDFGMARLLSFAFDADTGTLGPEPVSVLQLAHTAGPRSLCWHPSGVTAYVSLQSEPGVAVLHFEAATGALSLLQTVPAPAGRALPSAICVCHGSGNDGPPLVLLLSRVADKTHRGEGVVGSGGAFDAFKMEAGDSGRLQERPVLSALSGGTMPRDFAFVEPDFLIVANGGTGTICLFQLQASGGSGGSSVKLHAELLTTVLVRSIASVAVRRA